MISSFWLDISIKETLLFGLFTAAAALTGDLLASYYKRVVRIKDYSNLLKGQGAGTRWYMP